MGLFRRGWAILPELDQHGLDFRIVPLVHERGENLPCFLADHY